MDDVSIQVAVPDDAADLVSVHYETWLATYPSPENGITKQDIEAKLNQRTKEESVKWITSQIKNNGIDSLRLVARLNGKIVGYCLVEKQAEFNKLKAIYILPEAQGRSIGAKLIERGFAWLGNEKDIALEVVKYNTNAINFYKGLGFEIAGDAHNTAADLPSGAVMPEYRMIKKLSR